MGASSELGDFLKSRRAALRPEDVGITPHPTRRRVTGLRREELATLANVSITHYTRPEQGRATSVPLQKKPFAFCPAQRPYDTKPPSERHSSARPPAQSSS